ncbi:hypothetical protein OROMI_011059 [Orobanche minor]
MKYTTNLLLHFLIFSSTVIFLVQARTCFRNTVMRVYVVNALPQNSPPLFLHCASGDDELGNHTLTVGQNFNFKFCISVFKHTLFFCHLWWENKNIAFDVYNYKFDHKCAKKFDGGVCYWEARSDGIYISKDYPPEYFKKEYSW